MPSYTVTTSKTIHAPLSNVLAVLHNPISLARLNPLVIAVQRTKDPRVYVITDTLRVFGFSLGIQWAYSAKFTLMEDGIDTEVEAPGGTHLINQWRAKMSGEDVEVTENVIVESNALVRPLVIYLLQRSHKELLDSLAKQLESCSVGADHQRQSKRIGHSLRTIIACWVVSIAMPVFAMQFGLFHMTSYGLVWQAGVPIALAGILLIVAFMNTNDPYGAYHISLNIRPDADSSVPPNTEWLNMGYWEDTQVFPDACQALALKVIEAAQCLPGGHVLDVGHACGDSLLLHLCHPEVPRPATLTGITSILSQHSRSVERIANYQSSAPGQSCKVRLLCSDAIFRLDREDHPLNPLSSIPQFTSITAIDCAYHFETREGFLRQSLTRLTPGGTIALADLVVSKPLPFILRTTLSQLLAVRIENMITLETYEKQLKTIGYINVHIEDITHNVFPGFQMFLRSRGGLWRVLDLTLGSWVAAGGRFLIVSASKPSTEIDTV